MKSKSAHTLSVSLTPHQAARIRSAVDNGTYASDSEIIREALQLWEEREDTKGLDIDHLRLAYKDGLASGEGQDIDRTAFLNEMKAGRSTRG